MAPHRHKPCPTLAASPSCRQQVCRSQGATNGCQGLHTTRRGTASRTAMGHHGPVLSTCCVQTQGRPAARAGRLALLLPRSAGMCSAAACGNVRPGAGAACLPPSPPAVATHVSWVHDMRRVMRPGCFTLRKLNTMPAGRGEDEIVIPIDCACLDEQQDGVLVHRGGIAPVSLATATAFKRQSARRFCKRKNDHVTAQNPALPAAAQPAERALPVQGRTNGLPAHIEQEGHQQGSCSRRCHACGHAAHGGCAPAAVTAPPTCQVKYRVHSVAISVCTFGTRSSCWACANRAASIQSARRRHEKAAGKRQRPIARQPIDVAAYTIGATDLGERPSRERLQSGFLATAPTTSKES